MKRVRLKEKYGIFLVVFLLKRYATCLSASSEYASQHYILPKQRNAAKTPQPGLPFQIYSDTSTPPSIPLLPPSTGDPPQT